MFNWVPNTSFQPITIFEKSSGLDVCLGSKQTSPAVNPGCSYFFLNLPLHLLRRILQNTYNRQNNLKGLNKILLFEASLWRMIQNSNSSFLTGGSGENVRQLNFVSSFQPKSRTCEKLLSRRLPPFNQLPQKLNNRITTERYWMSSYFTKEN